MLGDSDDSGSCEGLGGDVTKRWTRCLGAHPAVGEGEACKLTIKAQHGGRQHRRQHGEGRARLCRAKTGLHTSLPRVVSGVGRGAGIRDPPVTSAHRSLCWGPDEACPLVRVEGPSAQSQRAGSLLAEICAGSQEPRDLKAA